jgi:GTP cyclohydrolase II
MDPVSLQRKYVNITVFDSEKSDSGSVSEYLNSFIESMHSAEQKIPEEYRATARIDFEVVETYGGNFTRIAIWYTRPETDDEHLARIKKENKTQKAFEDQELRTYLRLKKKYEKNTHTEKP